jgi:hypothetical protein
MNLQLKALLIEAMQIGKHKAADISINLYFDDLEGLFVVKLIFRNRPQCNQHFRSKSFIDSMLECYGFLKNMKTATEVFI